MREVNFGINFVDFKGVDIPGSTIAEELSKALFSAGVPDLPIDSADKYRAFKLSTMLISGKGVIDVSKEDSEFLIRFCVNAFSAGAYGQIVDILNV